MAAGDYEYDDGNVTHRHDPVKAFWDDKRHATQLQETAAKERIASALKLQRAALIKSGKVLPTALPEITSSMSIKDLTTAQERINKYGGTVTPGGAVVDGDHPTHPPTNPPQVTTPGPTVPTLTGLPAPAPSPISIASPNKISLSLGTSPVSQEVATSSQPDVSIAPTPATVPEAAPVRATGSGYVEKSQAVDGPRAIESRDVAFTPNAEQAMSQRTNGAWDNWNPAQRTEYLRNISGSKPGSNNYDLDAYAKKSMQLREKAVADNAAADAARGGPEAPGHYDATGKFLGEARFNKDGHLVDIPREAVRFVGAPTPNAGPTKVETPKLLAKPLDYGELTSVANVQAGPVPSFPQAKPGEAAGASVRKFVTDNVNEAAAYGKTQGVDEVAEYKKSPIAGFIRGITGEATPIQPPAPTLERLPTPSKPAPENSEPKYAAPPLAKPDDEERKSLAAFEF